MNERQPNDSPEFSPELIKELLDEFHAESDELLGAMRQALTAMEAGGRPDAEHLEALFRSTHTLKGVAAIAGVERAEELAHALEDVLRALSSGRLAPARAHLDLLASAIIRLEQLLAAHRVGQPLPEVQDLVARLAAARPVSTAPTTGAAPSQQPLRDLVARGLQPWRVVFAPTSERDSRGINVNSVRDRLRQAGELLSGQPVFLPGGVMEFVFLVGLREEPPLAAWEADGLRAEPLPPEAPAAAPAPEERAAAPSLDAVSLTPSHIVRVDLERLDDLMRIAGEMVIQRSRLEERIREHCSGAESLREIDLALGRSLRDLRKAITRVRLVPISELFLRIPFVVRDLASGLHKEVRVVVEGQQTEIDKYLAERLKEPLLHLVRNAVSHGIELPDERLAAGKPAQAILRLRAVNIAESIQITLQDDGRGIAGDHIAVRARALGLPVEGPLDARQLLQLLCAPGFSTRSEADRISGRGVGMAVVANTVRELGGLLTMDTTPGSGTTFSLRLPLTLSIADALIVTVGDETCAIPQASVNEIVQIAATEARPLANAEVVPYRDGLLPIVHLHNLFGVPRTEAAQLTLLVLQHDGQAVGLAVDRVKSRREIVVRALKDPLVRVPGIGGATELGEGRAVLILDPAALVTGVIRPLDATTALASSPP